MPSPSSPPGSRVTRSWSRIDKPKLTPIDSINCVRFNQAAPVTKWIHATPSWNLHQGQVLLCPGVPYTYRRLCGGGQKSHFVPFQLHWLVAATTRSEFVRIEIDCLWVNRPVAQGAAISLLLFSAPAVPHCFVNNALQHRTEHSWISLLQTIHCVFGCTRMDW